MLSALDLLGPSIEYNRGVGPISGYCLKTDLLYFQNLGNCDVETEMAWPSHSCFPLTSAMSV